MKDYNDCATTMTSMSSIDRLYQNIGFSEILVDECSSGIEAFQICESGPVVFALASSSKQENGEQKEIYSSSIPAVVSPPSSLPPEIRSPTIGKTSRYIYDLGPNFSSDSLSCPPTPTVCFSPSMDTKGTYGNDSTRSSSIDDIIKQLENGLPIILHDAINSTGTQVILSILNDYSFICVSPLPTSSSEPQQHAKNTNEVIEQPINSTESLASTSEATKTSIVITPEQKKHNKYMPLQDVNFLDVGKKNSKTLSNPILSSVNAMKCISIVSTTGLSFDFEASSILEREVILSSLSLILDEVNLDFEMIEDEVAPTPEKQPDVILSNQSSDDVDKDSIYLPQIPNLQRNERRKVPRFNSKRNNQRKPDSTDIDSNNGNIINESFSTDCSLEPVFNLHVTGPPVPTAVVVNSVTPESTKSQNCNALVLSNSNDIIESDQRYHWCTQCCLHALQEITETCSDMLCTDDDILRPNNATCSTAVEGCLMACIGDCIGDCIDFEALRGKRLLIESNITTMLGSSSQAASGCFEGHIWALDESKNMSASTCKQQNNCTQQRISIRNRASKVNAQARRLRRLRNEMTFIHSVKTVSQNMRWIQTTRSVDDSDNDDDSIHDTTSTGAGNHSTTYLSLTTAIVPIDNDSNTGVTTSSLLSCPTTSFTRNSKTNNMNSDLYYDSDPGEVKLRIVSRNKNSRRALLETLDLMNENEIWVNHHHDENGVKNKKKALALQKGNYQHNRLNMESLVLKDGDETKFIQEMTNGTMNLVWHPSQTEHFTNLSPVCVQAWIESGSRLNRNADFIQPKFMWKKGYEPSANQSRFLSQNTLYTIDLLDICRVLSVSSVDRAVHAFAKKSCSFTIETHSDIYLFECTSSIERDKMVHGLKLVIARLASQLIVGDENVYNDFFSSGNNGAPGEALDWNAIASGKSDGFNNNPSCEYSEVDVVDAGSDDKCRV